MFGAVDQELYFGLEVEMILLLSNLLPFGADLADANIIACSYEFTAILVRIVVGEVAVDGP